MTQRETNQQLSWLAFALACKRNALSQMFLRLRDIGMRAGTCLSLHRKFACLLDQVAAEQRKELDLINDIEEVEKKHALMRERKLLRTCDSVKAPQPIIQAPEEPEDELARDGLMKLLAWFALFSARPINHKNQ